MRKNYGLGLKCTGGKEKLTDKKMFEKAVEEIEKKDASILKEFMASDEHGNLSIRVGKKGNYIYYATQRQICSICPISG